MAGTITGQRAETAVAELLDKRGYKIIDLNWKTKLCEIDVIARNDNVVYFVEVKYRTGPGQGSGFEHITPKKLNQMKFAGRMWCLNHDWDGDYRLMGAEVSGLDYEYISFVEID